MCSYRHGAKGNGWRLAEFGRIVKEVAGCGDCVGNTAQMNCMHERQGRHRIERRFFCTLLFHISRFFKLQLAN